MNKPEQQLHQQLQSTIDLSATEAIRAQLTSAKHFNSYLTTGQNMKVGDYLTSPSGYFYAILQADGNFCVYRGPDPAMSSHSWLWGSQRVGVIGTYFAQMQSDGNFCVYFGTPSHPGPHLWGTADRSRPDGQFFLAIQDDGNLCVYQGTPDNNRGYVWGSQATDEVVDCTDITSIIFDVSQSTFKSVTPQRVYATFVTNSTSTPQSSTIGGSYTITETSGWENSLSVKVGITTSFKTGLPIVGEGEVEISTEITDTYTWNGSSSETYEFDFSSTVSVPANTTLSCTIVVSMSEISLPYTLTGTLIYKSGHTTQGTLFGTYRGTTSGHTSTMYSPVDSSAQVTKVEYTRLFPSVSASNALCTV